MVALTLLTINYEIIPSEIRIFMILLIFLSLSAFILSLFSTFLFYKFYRDTIKPRPQFLYNLTKTDISFKLYNNGHSAFYIYKFFVSNASKISNSISDFLPLVSEEVGFLSYSTVLEGRKVMPDQNINIFEIDFSSQNFNSTKDSIQDFINHIDGLVVEVHCRDIGKRYKTIIRKSININQIQK